jgi:hypothetical protein
VVGLFGSETEKVSGGRRGLDRKDKGFYLILMQEERTCIGDLKADSPRLHVQINEIDGPPLFPSFSATPLLS